jgi:hypothetical protein
VADFPPGRFVIASTDAAGARDMAGLTSQVKYMRNGLKRAGHEPALILVVVADGEQSSATDLIKAALDIDASAHANKEVRDA